jgi:uncharacterized alkaline shock family protein YloU
MQTEFKDNGTNEYLKKVVAEIQENTQLIVASVHSGRHAEVSVFVKNVFTTKKKPALQLVA